MKRIWIGIGVLVFFLLLSILVSGKTERILDPISQALETASHERNFEQACRLSQGAQDQWKQHRHFIASLTDLDEMDQIEGMLAKSEVYRQRRDSRNHAATCAEMSKAVKALSDAHRLTWWNLL